MAGGEQLMQASTPLAIHVFERRQQIGLCGRKLRYNNEGDVCVLSRRETNE